MRKFLLAALVIWASLAGAQSVPTTPNINLYVPYHGTPNWDTYMNADMNFLDSFLSGGTPLNLFKVNQYIDFSAIAAPTPPASPFCRFYYDVGAGQMTGINSLGGPCSSSGGGGGSGSVVAPGGAGTPIAYFPDGTLASVTGDGFTSDDGAGNVTVNSLATVGAGGIGLLITPSFQIVPAVFSTLLTCDPSLEGYLATVTDSSSNVLGATITGFGSFHVVGYCNGTNWVVANGVSALNDPGSNGLIARTALNTTTTAATSQDYTSLGSGIFYTFNNGGIFANLSDDVRLATSNFLANHFVTTTVNTGGNQSTTFVGDNEVTSAGFPLDMAVGFESAGDQNDSGTTTEWVGFRDHFQTGTGGGTVAVHTSFLGATSAFAATLTKGLVLLQNYQYGLHLAPTVGNAMGQKPTCHSTDVNGTSGRRSTPAFLDCWFTGTGSPEGAVSGNIGSTYSRQDGSAGTSLYIKESGSGNTGWKPVFTGSTSSNCAAVGTSANPSVASCSAAPAGSFSCAVAASTGTCVVNTTAVTANSEIFIQQRSDTVTGTRLSVTCNTGVSTVLPDVTAVSAGVSFTINLGTVAVNPECFSYNIVN